MRNKMTSFKLSLKKFKNIFSVSLKLNFMISTIFIMKHLSTFIIYHKILLNINNSCLMFHLKFTTHLKKHYFTPRYSIIKNLHFTKIFLIHN